MAQASIKELFNYKAEDIFLVIMDFEKYPNFLPEVSSCKIISEEKNYKDVEMIVNLIKTTRYVIRVYNEEKTKVWWELVEGDFFKKNNGVWTLDAIGSQTQVEYSLDVDFKIFVPRMIVKKAVSMSLPTMVKNFKKRVGSI